MWKKRIKIVPRLSFSWRDSHPIPKCRDPAIGPRPVWLRMQQALVWIRIDSIRFHSISLIESYPSSFVVDLEVCTEQYFCWICIAKSNSLFGFFCLLSGSGLVSDGYLLRIKKERERKKKKERRWESNPIALLLNLLLLLNCQANLSKAKLADVPLLRRNRRVRLHCCQPWLQ